MFFDTHCHLDLDAFNKDREQMINRAITAGVKRILNPSFDMASCKRATKLAHARSNDLMQIWCAVGMHPNHVHELTDAGMNELKQLITLPRVVAIGEIGLDYHWNKHPRQTQFDGFTKQIALARDAQLPIIIHCREGDARSKFGAYDDLLAILLEMGKTENDISKPFPKVLLHSFAGNSHQADIALSRGYFLGISGPVTYPKNETLREIVSDSPLSQLVIETDAPFLAPQKVRGKRNEPSYVPQIAERIAQIRGKSIEEIAQVTAENANKLFKLS
jgi:TatD DNase family protein